jgi:hypothetical protein
MENFIFVTNVFGCFSLLFLISLIIIFKFLNDRDSEFRVNHVLLMSIIEIYKETILHDLLIGLERQYNLDATSKVNSQVAFEKAKHEAIKESTKIIITKYLSKPCLKSLLRHYNIDGLSLLIITHLKR